MKTRIVCYKGKYYPQKALDFVFFELWIHFKQKVESHCGEFYITKIVEFGYCSEAIDFIENEFKKYKTENEKPVVIWSKEE